MADGDKGRSGVFREVTPMGVLAPALAAATSFALMSRVGLVGSLIGTAVTAAVTTMATQVYKNVMADSANRLRRIAPLSGGEGDAETTMGGTQERGTGTMQAATQDTAASVIATAPPDETGDITATMTRLTGESSATTTETPPTDTHIEQVAAERHVRNLQRRMALFSAIVAVIVALAVAGVILLATSGTGLGPTTIVITRPHETTSDATTTTGDASATGNETDSDTATPPDETTTDTDSTTDTPQDDSDTEGTGAGGTGSTTDPGTTEGDTPNDNTTDTGTGETITPETNGGTVGGPSSGTGTGADTSSGITDTGTNVT